MLRNGSGFGGCGAILYSGLFKRFNEQVLVHQKTWGLFPKAAKITWRIISTIAIFLFGESQNGVSKIPTRLSD